MRVQRGIALTLAGALMAGMAMFEASPAAHATPVDPPPGRTATPATSPQAGWKAVHAKVANHPKQAAAVQARIKTTQPAKDGLAASPGVLTVLPTASDPTITTTSLDTSQVVSIRPEATSQIRDNAGAVTATVPSSALNAIKAYATGLRLTATQVAAVKATIAIFGNTIANALGIGSCVDLIRARG